MKATHKTMKLAKDNARERSEGLLMAVVAEKISGKSQPGASKRFFQAKPHWREDLTEEQYKEESAKLSVPITDDMKKWLIERGYHVKETK